MKQRKYAFYILFLVFPFLVTAYEPIVGGEMIESLYSPLFLAQSGAGGQFESVSGDTLNPAASALEQRVYLDLSYAGIFDGGSYGGHAANFGIAYPTPTGVFTGSLAFLSADYDSFDPGQRIGLDLTFSKDLFPKVLFGAGVQGMYGFNNGASGFGGGLDLGIIHLPGTIGFLQDFSWGFALTQMGVGYKPGAASGTPSPFTPTFSARARLIESPAFDVDASARLGFPSFQNTLFKASLGATILDRVTIHTGWDIDLKAQLEGNNTSLLPSVGISALFRTDIKKSGGFVAEQGWSRSDISVHTGFSPLTADVYAAGVGTNIALGVVDNEPPAITTTYPEERYISANNDGASDELLLPITITDSRYIKGWTLSIYNDQGSLVRTIENKEQRPENATFQNIITRLLYVKQGVDVPEEIRWDGRTDDGTVAPDGAYRFVLDAVDDNGNAAATEEFVLTMDATAPSASIVEPESQDALIFSPNGDGNKDTIVIDQDGSEEDAWTVQVLDLDDHVVREETFQGALSDYTWDGRDGEGTLVPDGVYSVRSFATDRAENSGEASLSNIIVNTEQTPIGLTVDRSQISPNGDGVGDSLTATPSIPVDEGIREWRYRLLNGSGTEVAGTSGGAVLPTPWTVTGRSSGGSILPQGEYTIELTIRYNNGNRPVTKTPPITVDLTPPFASAQSTVDVFSPNGDGRVDLFPILQTADSISVWNGWITDETGVVRRSWEWPSQPEESLQWDGRDDSEELLPDGPYRYTLSGRDDAGNLTQTQPIAIDLDTRETPVFVSSDLDAFSPNGDGSQDQLTILPELRDRRGVDEYTLTILDETDSAIASIQGRGAPETALPWDGRLPDRSIVKDGEYRLRLQVDYIHGNRSTATSSPFIVDTVAPTADVALGDTIFSPDGDGNKDLLEIIQSSSREYRWIATVRRNNTVMKEFEISGTLSDFDWDGTDENGNIIADGSYRYTVSSVDEAGNRFESRPISFQIDTALVEIRLTQSETAFSPNGDDVKDSVVLTPAATSEDEIESWTFRIVSESGSETWRQERTGEFTPIEWTGEASRGTAPEGSYFAEIEARFVKGTVERARTARTILLDRTAPSADVTFSGAVFSPNGDGNLDTLEITQETTEEQQWIATVSDTNGRLVRSFEWVTKPAGVLNYGGLADERSRLPDGIYFYELFSTDEAGNYGTSGPREFEIYTAETPLSLFSDGLAFSPNGDGTKDSVTFTPRIGLIEGISSYAFTIRSEDETVVFEREGSTVPVSFVWDGKRSRRTVDDGIYRAQITLTYRHGNRPTAESEGVTLDTVAPAIVASSDFTIFSPDEDGRRDTLHIDQQSDPAGVWSGAITNGAGEEIRTFSWSTEVEPVVWNGRDASGNRVPDGEYTYRISGSDQAGNTGTAELAGLTVDTVAARLYVTVSEREFSPNGDGEKDQVSMRLITSRTDGVVSRTVDILGEGDRVARTWNAATASSREDLIWNGRTSRNTVEDGTYRIRYRIEYNNGYLAEALSTPVRLDTIPPELSADLQGLPFSPDNDGLNDELTVLLHASDAGAIAEWSFTILDRNQRPFQLFEGRGIPRREIIWDGRSNEGELVISAEDYPYRFTAVDSVGNSATTTGVIPIDILVVREGDRLKIQISNINFEPNSPALALDETSEAGRKNTAVLERLVEVFDKYSSYQIRIEGHAVNISGTQREEDEELQPLSTARADTVRTALIELGMEPDRITIEGLGGTDPIVPHTDRENRWKNRRVEFILIR